MQAAEIALRTARPEELDRVAEIYWQAWHESHAPSIPRAVVEHRGPAFFRDRVKRLDPPPVVALRDGRVLGFVAWRQDRLDQLWIAPEGRGLGLGSRLLAHAEAQMAAAGHGLLWLDCKVGNESARRLYEKHGWQVVDSYDKPLGTATGQIGVAVWRMEKELAGTAG